jgi:nucleoid-associated protein YgaU
MHKDLKIGLALGLVLAIIVMVRLATDQRLSPKARMVQLHNATAKEEFTALPNDFSQAELPQSEIPLTQPLHSELSESESAMSNLEPGDLTQNRPTTINTKVEQSQTNDNVAEPVNSVQYEQAEKIKTQKFHIIRKDQTLSAISKEYYGSPNKWKKILDANRDVIKDANKLQPGMKLIIPD